jgi:polyisoprenoid-binding protein YceI
MRKVLLASVAALVVVAGGGLAAFALRGGDAPAPPALSRDRPVQAQAGAAPTARPTPAPGSSAWTVVRGGETYVGYRVREKFATVGVKDAVGRTRAVDGSLALVSGEIRDAQLEADLSTLASDEQRRDRALADRAIETGRFPTAAFALTEPVELSRQRTTAAGELTLHGVTRPVEVSVRGQRIGERALELVGSAPIRFADFAVEPPSVAGVVTVEDHGTLEFKLRLRPRS